MTANRSLWLALVILTGSLMVAAGSSLEGSIGELGSSGDIESDVELESSGPGYRNNLGHKHGQQAGYPTGNNLGNSLGGKKEAPLSAGNLARPAPSAPSAVAASSSRNQHSYEESSQGELDKPVPVGLAGWARLMLTPLEFIKAISRHFKLPLEGLVEKIGHGLVFGVEALLQPLLSTIKIAERLFVPDQCRLQFFCRMGSYMELFKEQMLKFSPGFLEGSLQVKALSAGVSGKNCAAEYAQCEPRLKSNIEALRTSSEVSSSESVGILGYR